MVSTIISPRWGFLFLKNNILHHINLTVIPRYSKQSKHHHKPSLEPPSKMKVSRPLIKLPPKLQKHRTQNNEQKKTPFQYSTIPSFHHSIIPFQTPASKSLLPSCFRVLTSHFKSTYLSSCEFNIMLKLCYNPALYEKSSNPYKYRIFWLHFIFSIKID